MQQTMLKDSDWSLIDSEACRVIEFTPMAVIKNGKVRALSRSMPYASVTFQCIKIPHNIEGYICHKLDFIHLWAAFKERPLGENEEVIIFWTKTHYKRFSKIFSRFMPRLWVMVCKKGAYELMTDNKFRPELTGEARWNAKKPIMDWKPEVME